MAKFKDGAGRAWVLAIDVYLIERVMDRLDGLRLDQLLADRAKGLIELFGDPIKFTRVVWNLIEDDAEKAGVTPEQFGRALDGDPLEECATAFQEALADFSPSRQRAILKAMAAKGSEVAGLETAAALQEIEQIDAAKLIADRAKRDRTSSASATRSPASSGSTPAPEG